MKARCQLRWIRKPGLVNYLVRSVGNSSRRVLIVRFSFHARGVGFEIFTDSFILDLSAAVDVYSDWVDACDTVAKEAASRDHEHGALDPGQKNSDT